jgi:dTDP-4-amino-4,6-dideoxygalactose transaminase
MLHISRPVLGAAELVAIKLYEELLTLPLHTGLRDEEIDYGIASVMEFLSLA